MKIFRAIKFWVIWALITTTVALFILLAQMYSRDWTIDNVRDVEFDLVFNHLIEHIDTPKIAFKKIADDISIKKGEVVLFPLALLSIGECLNNGPAKAYNSLCLLFSDLNDWKDKSKNEEHAYFSNKSFAPYKGKEYLVRNVKQDLLLIGRAGDFSYVKPWFQKLWYFIKFRVAGHYLNNQYGFKKMIDKGLYPLVIFLLASFVGTLVYRSSLNRRQKKYQGRVFALEAEIKIHEETASNFLNEYNKLKSENLDIQHKSERDLEDILDFSQRENTKKDDLIADRDNALSIAAEKLAKAEKKIEELRAQKVGQTSKYNHDELEKEYKKTYQAHSRLLALWSSQLKWSQRLEIEEKVSEAHRFPFTASIAFIAFEEYVNEYFEDKFPEEYREDQKQPKHKRRPLANKISSITDSVPEISKEMNDYRDARNDWFHDGILPDKKLIRDLLRFIDRQKARV